MIKSLAAAVALVGLACATASRTGGAAASAGEGERLYRGHCGSCHRLRDPHEQTRERWAWAVDRFGDRAHLSGEERKLVLGYLQSHAKDAGAGAGGEMP
jgi:mono/diheme cytochrome c family protein